MDLFELLAMWFGPLDRPNDSARCLFLGAGFTKACNADAPLFTDYCEPLRSRLLNAPPGTLPTQLACTLNKTLAKWLAPSDLVELYDQVFGRRAVAELILSEPPESAAALHSFGQTPCLHAPPHFADSVFRTFKQWTQVLAAQPAHLAVLDPAGPAVVLGRLVAEGALPLVLSTNWDAYVELGCWLAGLNVTNVGDPEDTPSPNASDEKRRTRLVVYDRAEDVVLLTRHHSHPHLLKLHGGVDGIDTTLRNANNRQISQEDTDASLARSFLVATSDLTHWRDSSQWVQDATSDALRSHRTLFVGVSGADPVTFRATRARIAEWERHAEQHRRMGPYSGLLPTEALPDWPSVGAIDFDPAPRLFGMMAARRPGGVSYPVVKADGGKGIRGIYAWWFGSRLLGALDQSQSEDRVIFDRFRIRLGREISREAGPTPLVDVLCNSLGPSARWAAIAEGRPPLDGRATRPEHRWRYAPWFAPLPDQPTADRANLRLIAAAAVALSQVDVKDTTDAWSGVVHVPDNHRGDSPLTGTDILPLPWPWPAQRGLASLELRTAMANRFLWVSGRARSHLASPQLLLTPIGNLSAWPTEMMIAGAAARVKQIDWIKEATK